ncbi:MAG: rRNA maturation RNase YbeY [Cryomorphaceae bacterium]|nr:rRNA maturation RNase YbeY [Cryomorphaceae bacterium]
MRNISYLPNISHWPIHYSAENLRQITDYHDLNLKHVQFHLLNDEDLRTINREHLNHDYYTDIITFPYNRGKNVSGEIFISIDRVRDNATDLKISLEEELSRVIFHGILHLCGLNDHSEIEKAQMRQAENHFLSILFHGEQKG